jgi:hypothetical protein
MGGGGEKENGREEEERGRYLFLKQDRSYPDTQKERI